MHKNKKHCFYSTSTDFQRKRTTGNQINPGRTSKTKVFGYFERPMSCKTYPRYGHIVKDAMKQQRRVQSAAAKDTTKICAPAQKSDATTAETTTKHAQETTNIQKRNRNRSSPNKTTHTQTIGHSKTSQYIPTSLLYLLKRSKEHLEQKNIKIPDQNKSRKSIRVQRRRLIACTVLRPRILH